MKKQISFIACAGSLALGIAFGPKSYPVSHTEGEWGQHIQGLQGVRDVIHRSDLPANTAHQNDIYSQVLPQIKADTTKKR